MSPSTCMSSSIRLRGNGNGRKNRQAHIIEVKRAHYLVSILGSVSARLIGVCRLLLGKTCLDQLD